MANKYMYEEVKETFENKNYTLLDNEYINCKQKLNYICNTHPDKGIQSITFDSIKKGHGCFYCGLERTNSVEPWNKTKYQDILDYFKNLNDLVLVDTFYKNGRLFINYRCNKHKDFLQTRAFNNFKRSIKKCEYCYKEEKRKSHTIFIQEINKINKNIKILSKYKGENNNVKCECQICGTIWEVNPRTLIEHCSCPKCRYTHSNAELLISKFLDENNIDYELEKRFIDCKDIRTLPFDFYIPHLNLVIEYDGEFHYKSTPFKSTASNYLDDRIKKDSIKTKYCEDNNIKLLRIPYWEKDNIETILKENIL